MLLKGEKELKVCYDKEKDIVSIYFEEDSKEQAKDNFNIKEEKDNSSSNVYNTEKAANLILDTVDIVSNSSIVGFRVFNASKYYDSELLNVADKEVLTERDVLVKPKEKVIATVTKEGILN